MIVLKRPTEQKPTQKPTPTRKSRLGKILSLPGFLYGVTDNLGGLADTLLVSVSIHPQRHGLVAVAQGLRHAGHIRTIGNGDAGESVPLCHNRDKSESPCAATGFGFVLILFPFICPAKIGITRNVKK